MSRTAPALEVPSQAPSFAFIAEAVGRAMEPRPAPPFVRGVTRIPLNVPTYGAPEVIETLDSMMSTWVTMGKKVRQFEEMWAAYVGVPTALMVNSGSSANLLALSAMKACGWLKDGDEIITPALTWATTVFPIAQVGCVPVLVDVDRDTYNISPAAIERAITPKTKAIMPVHLLGNPCDMGAIRFTAALRDLYIIEDACEAHGAEWRNQRAGSLGDVSTFSFFFSHHISTIEGGMVLGHHPDIMEACRSLRAHGWIREMEGKKRIAEENPDIDPRFLFAHAGYNFRPTEIQGAFGIHQVPRLEGLVAHRREVAAYWNQEFAPYQDWLLLPHERPKTRHSYFAYPLQVRAGAPFTAKELQAHLEQWGVETRPIEAGNMAMQPAMKAVPHRAEPLPNAQYIHDNAFFFGCHQGVGFAEREAVAGYIHQFMKERGA